VDAGTVRDIEEILKNGKFRNKSHVIEMAIEALKRDVNGGFVEALKDLGGFGK
jgi:Arc/MetJ-type ribon-helix-helix transcriptional regulator